MSSKHILFVCSANICRSPMARALFDDQLGKRGLQTEVETRSAGIQALVGEPAAAFSQLALAEQGIDLRAHRARQLSGQDVAWADVILVMTRAIQRAVIGAFPQAEGKTYLLSEVIGQTLDIEDPYGGWLEPYRQCAEELSRILEAGLDQIIELTEGKT